LPPAERAPIPGPLPWVLARRFLRGRQSQLLDGTARAALLATALGVTSLVVAMALMTGYTEDLQRKLLGDNAAVGAYPVGAGAVELPPEVRAALTEVPGVVRVDRVSYGQGLLAGGDPDRSQEVVLRGVEAGPGPGPPGRAAARPEQLATGADGVAGVVLGAELARKLGAEQGEVLRLAALGFTAGRPRFRYRSLRVSGTFETGFSEFDSAWAVVDRAVVEALSGQETGAVLYELTLDDPSEAPRVAAAAEEILGPDFLVTDWRHLNRDLFFALRLQKMALFVALGLIVLVSTFNVASTLVVLVRERMRDIGALGAMGLSPRRLATAFVLYGLLLGGVGTALGVAVGWTLSWVMTTFELIHFDAEVAAIYFIDSVPFRVEWGDVAMIVTFSLLLTLLACIVPALRAARVDPSRALRYE